jgi:hypothetical protein
VTDRDIVTAYAIEKGWSIPESTATRVLFVKDEDWFTADFAGDHSAPGQRGMLTTLSYAFGGEEYGPICTLAVGEAEEMGYDIVDAAKKWLDGDSPTPGSRKP